MTNVQGQRKSQCPSSKADGAKRLGESAPPTSAVGVHVREPPIWEHRAGWVAAEWPGALAAGGAGQEK